ncbi:hypothetical protein LCGC14_0566550 [marine sediment metagenome]|uniref:Uncharacterized protein n=1 Tax=marine sediment metagenome TaxID=412755 RepID=A0A0F9RQN2_9ZZZZ
MPIRGKRKFICLNCGKGTYFRSNERNSRFRIQCRHCGSYSLDPAPKSKVKKDLLKEGENHLLPGREDIFVVRKGSIRK